MTKQQDFRLLILIAIVSITFTTILVIGTGYASIGEVVESDDFPAAAEDYASEAKVAAQSGVVSPPPPPPPPPPPNTDPDGDGVQGVDPDIGPDRCPFVSGQGNQFGGVSGVDGCPVNSDGDELVDGLDHCPFEAGPSSNGGCPTAEQPAPPPQPQAPVEVEVPQITMPSTGPCVIATQGNRVNIREEPSTAAANVGAILPNRLYEVAAQSPEPDGTWYLLRIGGWVAGYVLRFGGDNCDSLPGAAEDVEIPEAVVSDVQIAELTGINLSEIFSVCPQQVSDAQRLPIHLLLGLADSDFPCDAASELLTILTLDLVFRPLDEASSAAMLAQCPADGSALVSYLEDFANWRSDLASMASSQITPDNVCAVARAVVEKRNLPIPMFQGQAQPRAIGLAKPALVPSNHLIGRIQACSAGGPYGPAYKDTVANQISELLIPDGLIPDGNAGCAVLSIFFTLGDLNALEEMLFMRLAAPPPAGCGLSPVTGAGPSAPTMVLQARLLGASIQMILQNPNLCNDPNAVIQGNVPSPSVQNSNPSVPNALTTCNELAGLLEARNATIKPTTVAYLLHSNNPCLVANNIITAGAEYPMPDNLRNCVNVLDNGHRVFINPLVREITTASSWYDKITNLGELLNLACMNTLPGGGATNAALFPMGPLPNNLPKLCATFSTEVTNSSGQTLQIRGRMVSIIPSAAGGGGFETHAETALITQEIPPGGGQFSITAMVFDQSATPNSRLEVHAWPETGLSLNTALPATPIIDPTLAQCGLRVGDGVPGDGGGASNLPDTPTVPNPPTRYPITQPPQTYDTYVSNVSTLVVTEVDGQQVYGFQLPEDLSEELFTAVFMGESPGTSRHVYLLESGETSTMATDVQGEELFPAPNPDNSQIAFLGIDQSGQTSLKIRSLANGWQVTLMTDSPQMTLAHIPMAWSPSTGTLLVTITDANGIPGIYEFNLSDPASINMPTLLVQNASAPAIAQSGAFMAYVREADGASSIYARAVQSGRENPITVPEPGLLCQSPAFSKDANSLILFFVCQSDGQSTLYRYDQQGDQDMALDLGGINVQNPAPGPGLGFLAFDDGNSIYFLDDQGGNLTELLTLEGVQSTHIRWPSLPAQ